MCGHLWLGQVALLILLGSLKGLGVDWLQVDLEWPQKNRAFLEVGFHQAHIVHIVGREGRCEPCLARPWRGTTDRHLCGIVYWPKQVIRPAPIQDLGKQTPAFDGKSCKATL